MDFQECEIKVKDIVGGGGKAKLANFIFFNFCRFVFFGILKNFGFRESEIFADKMSQTKILLYQNGLLLKILSTHKHTLGLFLTLEGNFYFGKIQKLTI